MSDLSNLYISASYYGVVNLSDATEPFASQSEAKIYLHDGVGENLGISFNQQKRVSIDNGLTVSGSLVVSGSKILTGSLSVSDNITAGGSISAGTGSFDTIHARKLNITIESSSTIYNSGSNIFGDDASDVQTLNGSVYVPNLLYLKGNSKDTDLRINEKLDTGSFNTFSSSVNTEQQSQDGRLDSIEAFTQSLVADFVTELEYSSSISQVTSSLLNQIDTKLDTGSYLVDSASFNSRIDTKLNTSTYTTDSSSFDSRIDTKLNTSTFNSFSSSVSSEIDSVENTNTEQQSQINSLITDTGSYVKLDTNNTFNGNQTISGSVNGNVEDITITSQTASIDCSLGNFFTVTLPTGSDTHFTATNIIPGQTVSVKVETQTNTTASIDSNSIKMINGGGYVPTQINTTDILTFVSFDTSFLYGVAGSFFN